MMKLVTLLFVTCLFACSETTIAQQLDCDPQGQNCEPRCKHGFHPDQCDRVECGPGGQPVPEPATLFLVGSGLAGLGILGRRKHKVK